MENKFAFIIHPRDWSDVSRKYKWVRFIPRILVEIWCLFASPVIVSKVSGLKNQKTGKEIEGYIVAIPIIAKQMLKNRKLAKKRIISAIKKVEKKDVKIVGLGALTSSVTNGGKDIVDSVNVGITTGHGYTVNTVVGTFIKVIKRFNLKKEELKVAVVGATGSIGSGVSEILAEKGVKNFIFIESKKREKKLEEFKNDFKNRNKVSVNSYCDIREIKNADIIITATNAPETLIKNKHISPGMIIINDAQPSDISPEIIKNREDVLVLEGGLVNTKDVKSNFNFSLSKKDDNYSCLGEVMILAANDWLDRNNLGRTNLDLIKDLDEAGSRMGFVVSDFQNSFKIYSEEDLKKFANNLL